MSLNRRQKAFVAEYLKDLNASQAALRAGYSARTARSIGTENLQKPAIKAAIEAAITKRAERVEVKTDDVLRELLRLGLSDAADAFSPSGQLLAIRDMPLEVRRAIASVKVTVTDEGETIKEVKFWDKPRGLEMLGRHLKLFTDRVEVKLESVSDEALLAEIDRRAASAERGRLEEPTATH